MHKRNHRRNHRGGKRVSNSTSTRNKGRSNQLHDGFINDSLMTNRKEFKNNNKSMRRARLQAAKAGLDYRSQFNLSANPYQLTQNVEKSIEEGNESYPQTRLTPISVEISPNAVWDFCVAYSATAMWNAQTANDTVQLLGGGSIGTWYLGALTLFYSLYQCSIGAIPPLQRVSRELMNVMHAIAPTNFKSVSYIMRWPFTNILSYMQTLPYRSFSNPTVSLAPWTGNVDLQGRRTLTNTIPAFTLEDFSEIGPRAFEYVQRSLLAENVPIIDYTTDGPYTHNTSLFNVAKDNSVAPVSGFFQVVNESPMYQSDYWLLCLQFATGPLLRDSYNVRTIQKNTILAVYRIMTGLTHVSKININMVDVATVMAQEVSTIVGGDVNSTGDTLKTLDQGSGAFTSEYVSQVTAGEWITKILADTSRRWGKLSCMGAGTTLPGTATSPISPMLIGGGSQYVTGAIDDNSISPMSLVEDLAALSSFVTQDGCLFVPLLVSYGAVLTVDMITPTGRSVLYFLEELYPTLEGVYSSFDLLAPGINDLPDNIDLTNQTASFTSGPGPLNAVNEISSMISLLQGCVAIGNASGSADGLRERHLYITHVLETPPQPPRFNLSPTFKLRESISTKMPSSRAQASKLTRLFPVFYTPPIVNNEVTAVPAFQILYGRPYSVEINVPYAQYRSQGWSAQSHQLSANLFSPSEQTARASYRNIIGDGGAFHDVFLKDGQWVSALEHVAQGIGGLFSPQVGEWSKVLAGKVGKALHQAFKENKIPSYVRNPVDSGKISLKDYQAVLNKHYST